MCSQFPTGVTVVTAYDGSGAVRAMTLSAFMSISLDPLLVMTSVSKRARMRAVLDEEAEMGISILAQGQEDVSSHFAGASGSAGSKSFAFEERSGVPVVPGALAHMRTRIASRLDAGDHRIYFAEPLEIWGEVGDRRPLVFCQGTYMALAPGAAVEVDWATEYATVTGLV